MELKDLLVNPEVLGDLSPEDESYVVALAKRCQVQGKFRLVYDSESFYDSPHYKELQALAFALNAMGREHYNTKATGEYYTGCEGRGWFSFGIGSPLASAICGTFVDESHYLDI